MALDRLAKGFFSRCHGGFLAVAAAGLFGCHVLSRIYRSIVKGTVTKLCDLAFRDLKKIQEDLRKERDFLAAILKATGATVAVLDPEGRVVRYDPGREDTGGYSPDDVLGKYIWDCFIPPEDRDADKAIFAQFAAACFPVAARASWSPRTAADSWCSGPPPSCGMPRGPWSSLPAPPWT